ncbi:MAG TPA: hydrogenase small subunit [Dissulfurispiraceae bacterium]|nr:hydrogenase small subunit [Dissulfurispiraceae bacterium]
MISRRDFLRYAGMWSAALGLSATDLIHLEDALANPSGPAVIWLQGAACTGCSISFMNRISSSAPSTAANVLTNSVNLVYHPNLSAVAGESVYKVIEQAYSKGNYILAVEGGVPTAFGGAACWAWTYKDMDTTFLQAVQWLAPKAAKILSVGSCAAFGGIPASGGNPTGIKSVSAATGKPTINIAGCPPHPDWIVGVIAQLIAGKTLSLDSYGRPSQYYNKKIHDICPNKDMQKVKTLGVVGCYKEIGCRGPETKAVCPTLKWNNGTNWCIGANAPCLGCTEPTFPGSASFSVKAG